MFKLFRRTSEDELPPDELLDEPQPIAIYESVNHPPIESSIAAVQYVGSTAVATISSTELTGPDAANAVADLLARLQQGGVLQVVLDAQSLQLVDQDVFRALVESCNRLVQAGGKVALAGAASTLQQALRSTGFDRVFPICSDVMAGMNAVERRASGAPQLGW